MPRSKNGFISIELVILASIMLTAGGYGISHLTNNATGALKMSDSNISRVINEMNGKLYLGDELANGIYNFDLYIEGEKYVNEWSQDNNRQIKFTNADLTKSTVDKHGYTIVKQQPNYDIAYVGEYVLDNNGYQYLNEMGQKFYFEDGKDYILSSSNVGFDNIYITYFDDNNLALGEENYNVGEFKSKVYIPDNNRVIKQFNAKYFTVRLELDGYINNLGMHNTYLGVYQIPKDVTLSSDGLKLLNNY